MAITYIFGNGLSIAYSSEYQLPKLTNRVRAGLQAQPFGRGQDTLLDAVRRLYERLQGDQTATIDTFENYAGPIDRLAFALEELGELALVAESETAQQHIKETAKFARDIYTRSVAVVLGEVTAHPNDGDWSAVDNVANTLFNAVTTHGEVNVFTLNYDALLDSALIKAGREKFADEFSGYGLTTIQLNGISVTAHRWREPQEQPENRPIRLRHLHGAATWLRHDGRVLKVATLDDLRKADVWNSWAKGSPDAQAAQPLVVLGDRKDQQVSLPPFSEQYVELAVRIAESDKVTIAGYGFGDEPLNRAIREHLRPKTQIVVVNPDRQLGSKVRKALGGREFEFLNQGLS